MECYIWNKRNQETSGNHDFTHEKIKRPCERDFNPEESSSQELTTDLIFKRVRKILFILILSFSTCAPYLFSFYSYHRRFHNASEKPLFHSLAPNFNLAPSTRLPRIPGYRVILSTSHHWSIWFFFISDTNRHF